MEDNKKMDYSKLHMIKASAGSGKTYTLTQRLAESIDNGIEPDKFLVTTFTCNAAAELCERIYRELLKSKGPQIADAFLDSMVNTVHSICQTLLNDHCIAAGLSPSLRPIPETLTKMILDRAIADILDLDEEKTELLERLSLQENWKGYLKDIIEKARCNGIDSDILKGSDVLSQNAEQNISEIRTFFKGNASVDLKAIVREYKNILRYVQREGLTDGGKKLFDRISGFVRFPSWSGLIMLTRDFGGKFYTQDNDDILRVKVSEFVRAHERVLERNLVNLTDHPDLKVREYQEQAKVLLDNEEKAPENKEKNENNRYQNALFFLTDLALADSPTWGDIIRLASSQIFKKDLNEDFADFRNSLQSERGIASEMSHRIINSKELLADIEEVIRFLFKLAADAIKAFASYKEQFGLIDFDDLEARVRGLIGEPSFLEDLSERVHQFMVDEFQDTSPIQLELMNGFHRAIHEIDGRKETIWVGDPKQAIYSFRGAVTTLMTETLKKVPDDENDDISDEKEKHRKTLKDSHRSKRELVELSNRVFTRAFLNTHDKNDVRLGVERKDPEGGKISSWLLVTNAKRASDTTDAKALAAGIAKLMDQEEFKQKGYKPSDIAVLCRTGAHCKAVSSALAERNIPSTNSSGKLLDTIECQLVLSAYQYALDKRNILAATRYAVLSGEKNVAELFGSMVEKRQKGESLQETFQFLEERFSRIGKRDGVIDLTPGELLERVIQTLNLDRLIDRMKFPEARRCNLDALRKAANDYLQIASAGGLSTSPAGFLAWIHGADLDAATAVGGKLVQVMTYHTAKGLEWPIVILYSLNWTKKLRERIFQTRALSVDHFLPENPLEGRSIHCWPYPFGKSEIDELKAKLEEEAGKESLVKKLNDLDILDAKNLFYVGVTRARDHVIFAMRAKTKKENDKRKISGVNTGWIDNISPTNIFNWPSVEGEAKDDDGWLPKTGFTPNGEEWEPVANDLTLETKILSADAPSAPAPSKPIFLDPLSEQKEFLPAKLNPSEAEKDVGTATLVEGYQMSEEEKRRINAIRGDDDAPARFGNAFHQYIELHPQNDEEKIAKKYLVAHDCPSDDNTAKVLVNQTKALYDWVDKKWPNGQVLREVPITLKNSKDQRFQGFIDMLIETDGGYAIIDHKTHSKEKDAEDYAAKQWAQLNIYRQAVEKATGKKVLGTYIHLPTLGKIYEIGPKNDTKTDNADAQ